MDKEAVFNSSRGSLTDDQVMDEETNQSVNYTSLSSNKRTLEKQLGLSHGFSLMVGLILGSGIFISPGLVAKDTSSSGMALVIWISSGIIALMGSLCFCELGCIIKMAGGSYANLLYIYGKIPAFLSVWTTCLVIDPSSLSAIALTIGVYFTKPFFDNEEEAESTAKLIAFGVILIGCVINCVSIKLSSSVQRFFAIAQISAVVFTICVGIWELSHQHFDNFHNIFNGTEINTGNILHLGVALFGGLWSFDGWSAVNNVIEELHNVERNLFLTVITSFPFIIICYLLVIISFLTLLSHKDMASSNAVGVDFIKRALGVKVSYFMMVLVGLSSYGTLNGTIFAQSRLSMSAAREGHMPYVFSLIHKKTGAPIPSTLLMSLIACIMLIPSASNINTLILLFSQAQWVMYGTSILGVIVLRIREPNVHRPFKIFILIPVLLTLLSAVLIIIPFFKSPLESGFVFIFILFGIPVYFVFIHFYLYLPNWWKVSTNWFYMKSQKWCNLVQCSKEDD